MVSHTVKTTLNGSSDDDGHPAPPNQLKIRQLFHLNFINYQPDEIRRIRNDLDMTRGEFGKLFFSTAATIKGWELGKRTPTGSAMRVLRIADEMTGEYNSNINNLIRRTVK